MNTATISIHRASSAAWARYCMDNDVTLPDYSDGYAMIQSPHASAWLARGFDEMLKAIRDSQK